MNPSVETWRQSPRSGNPPAALAHHGTSLQGFRITRHLFHTWIQQRQKL